MGRKEKYTIVPIASSVAYIMSIFVIIGSLILAFNETSTLAIVFAIIGGSLMVTGAVIGLHKEEIEFERKSGASNEDETTGK
ncbi:MAG: hypothetical protein H7647_09355 [Candidatus Heimdallarchaeota archaeon]|nr:hypothetical protein [Candidatus Heimdallarchaeota archaeon]MCK4254634.1 hypothetical protein [Candidatus Heimdallarchaeota archaeon]